MSSRDIKESDSSKAASLLSETLLNKERFSVSTYEKVSVLGSALSRALKAFDAKKRHTTGNIAQELKSELDELGRLRISTINQLLSMAKESEKTVFLSETPKNKLTEEVRKVIHETKIDEELNRKLTADSVGDYLRRFLHYNYMKLEGHVASLNPFKLMYHSLKSAGRENVTLVKLREVLESKDAYKSLDKVIAEIKGEILDRPHSKQEDKTKIEVVLEKLKEKKGDSTRLSIQHQLVYALHQLVEKYKSNSNTPPHELLQEFINVLKDNKELMVFPSFIEAPEIEKEKVFDKAVKKEQDSKDDELLEKIKMKYASVRYAKASDTFRLEIDGRSADAVKEKVIKNLLSVGIEIHASKINAWKEGDKFAVSFNRVNLIKAKSVSPVDATSAETVRASVTNDPSDKGDNKPSSGLGRGSSRG